MKWVKAILVICFILSLAPASLAQKKAGKKCDSCLVVKTGTNELFICRQLQDTARCQTGVMVRIRNAGNKPVSKYVLYDPENNTRRHEFDGLMPGDTTAYQCMRSINVPFDNDMGVWILNKDITYSLITYRATVWDNVLKTGKVTLQIGVDYDDTHPFDSKVLQREVLLYPLPETVIEQ